MFRMGIKEGRCPQDKAHPCTMDPATSERPVPASYPPYHREVGAMACRWFEINSAAVTCASCAQPYIPTQSIGRRECWVHPGVHETGTGGGATWSCCGNPCFPLCPLTADVMRISNYGCVVGCRRADHHTDRQLHGTKPDHDRRREQRALGWTTVLPHAHRAHMGIPSAHLVPNDHPVAEKVGRKYGLEFCAVNGRGPIIRSRLAHPDYADMP